MNSGGTQRDFPGRDFSGRAMLGGGGRSLSTALAAVAAMIAVLAIHGLILAGPAGAQSARAQAAQKVPPPVLAPWHKPKSYPKSKKAPGNKKSQKGAAAPAASAPEPKAEAEAPEEDVWAREKVVDGLKSCVARMAAIRAVVDIAEPFKKGACGAPAAVEVKRVGDKNPIEISPPAVLRCDMALQLYRFIEESLQPAAVEIFGSPIVRFQGISSYSCRNRYGAKEGRLSEHALANALDVGNFKLADGRTVRVLTGWGPTARDTDKPAGSESEVAGADLKRGAEQKTSRAKRNKRGTWPRLARAVRNGERGGVTVPPVPIKRSTAMKRGDRFGARKAGADPVAKVTKTGLKVPAPVSRPKREVRATEPAKQNEGKGAAAERKAWRPTNESRFLKRVHKEACRYFGTVLGPEANEAHRDHFHFDMAPRRRSNYCQ